MLMQQLRGQLIRIAAIEAMARKSVGCKERGKGVMAKLLGLIFFERGFWIRGFLS
jgi:hypothetical protein